MPEANAEWSLDHIADMYQNDQISSTTAWILMDAIFYHLEFVGDA